MGRRENGFGTEGTGDAIGPGTGGSVSPPPGAVDVSIGSTSDALSGAVASTDAVGLLEFSDAVGVLADTPALSDAVCVHSCVAATSDAVGVLACGGSSGAGCSGAGRISGTTVPSGVSVSGEPSMLPGAGGIGDGVRSSGPSTSER